MYLEARKVRQMELGEDDPQYAATLARLVQVRRGVGHRGVGARLCRSCSSLVCFCTQVYEKLDG